MTPEYKEFTDTISVPKNTGIDGFVHTIKEILKRPRVQNVSIDARGKVTYTRYVRNGEIAQSAGVDFEFLTPNYIIRNGVVEEIVVPPNASAAVVVSHLFEAASRDNLYPIAIVGGANTKFWEWHALTTGVELRSRKTAYGLPFLIDRYYDDSILLMCAAYEKGVAFLNTQQTYKVIMDGTSHIGVPALTEVDIL
jgi:hypothetical protein